MDYKPYSIEWSRKRYLSEAIQQYFDNDVSVDVVLNDIVDILFENACYHKERAEKFEQLMTELQKLNGI
jgi:hypothetical protein